MTNASEISSWRKGSSFAGLPCRRCTREGSNLRHRFTGTCTSRACEVPFALDVSGEREAVVLVEVMI